MRFIVQWYADDKEGAVFRKNDNSKLIGVEKPYGTELNRSEFSRILGKFGFVIGRWNKTEWGSEATARHGKFSESV